MKKRISQLLFRTIDLLPIIVFLVLLAVSISAVFFLILDAYRIEYIAPVGLLLAVILSVLFVRRAPSEVPSKERNICNIVVLVGIGFWVCWNGMLTSQHLFIDRDPAIYANASIWLVGNDSLKPSVSNALEDIEGVTPNGNGFNFLRNSEVLNAQGLHLLPALLAIGGRLFGVAVMLHLNVLFGASALLALYAAARHVMLPRWAIIVPAVVSVTMPFLYFSRDTYGEPLAATFTFGFLALLGYALKQNRVALWFLAGLMAGAGTLIRIDGYLTVAAVLGFLFIILSLSTRGQRRRVVVNSIAMSTGIILVALLSMADLLILSKGYYLAQSQLMRREFLLIAAIAVVGIASVAIAWRNKTLLQRIDERTKRYRSEIAAAAILIGAVVLVSRPLWFKGYLFPREGLREANTVQSFSEYSTYWVSWYIGDAAFIAGVAGIALAAFLLLRRWNAYLGALLIVVLSTSIIYLLMPSIYPDQIWASRRMIPVILPGIVLFGVFLLAKFIEKTGYQKLHAVMLYISAVSFLVLTPLVISKPLLLNRDTVQLSYVNDICRALPPESIVVWSSRIGGKLLMPTRGVCSVGSVNYGTGKTITQSQLKALAQAAASENKRVVYGMDEKTLELIEPNVSIENRNVIVSFNHSELERRMIGAPQLMIPVVGQIYLFEILEDGTLKSLDRANDRKQ